MTKLTLQKLRDTLDNYLNIGVDPDTLVVLDRGGTGAFITESWACQEFIINATETECEVWSEENWKLRYKKKKKPVDAEDCVTLLTALN